MRKIKLYIFQAPRTVVVSWEEPPPGKYPTAGWLQNKYYHPDVEIFVARARCLAMLNYDLIGYHLLLALQDANMPFYSLQRVKPEGRKKASRKISKTQLPLFPLE